ncbi:methyltransferase [Amycolatopsis rifamycinica]|uniref:O-methyltransferase n=1 Tax=Amycolatopsis rifamycinica TaxID=287986 RepID=A0A066U6F0_9PSEU|nr:methyltransferase [Amycolatopsis rifamycinica]KDN22655.1 hypothetical protein DV20_08035 [Amycolatopsis rifamycinica]
MTTVDNPAAAGPLPSLDDLHARQLFLLASAGRLAKVVHVLVELRIADLVGDGVRTAEDLAAATGTHPDALLRVLRAAASVGVFAEGPDRAFSGTPVSDALRADNPRGLLPLVKYNHLDLTWKPYERIMHSVRTGEPAFDQVHGRSFFEHLENEPESGAFFERFMMHFSRVIVGRELPGYRLHRFSRIADLGGGDGWFIAQVLLANPAGTGVLMDLPRVASSAPPVLAEHGVADRVTVVPGDFFTDPIPGGCDAYLFKGVLHNWSDEDVRRVLRRVRAAIGDSGARLLVWDQVVAAGNVWDHAKFLDIDMLVLFGGRERTLAEWRTLFAEAGFALTTTAASRWSMLECVPA